jgi:serine protease Do
MNENNYPENEQLKETPDTASDPVSDNEITEPAKAAEPESAEASVPEQAQEESSPAELAEESEQPAPVYRWEYQAQRESDQAALATDSRRGIRNYAIVMTVCFAVSLIVLFAALVGGWGGMLAPMGSGNNGGGYREIFIRDGVDSDALTMQEISAQGNRVVVAISVKTNLGSGVGTGIVMTQDGYIATNSHVVNGAKEILVQTYDGKKYNATLIGESEIDDLAVIKIDAKGLEVAKFGKSSDALVGDAVVVIGHPAGLEFGWTSTYGRLSAINRDIKIRDDDGTMTKKMTLIQTDANVNSGNSGGPMFNDHGEVIGIITLKLTGNYEGLGFAIPIDSAMPLLTALKEKGTVDGVQSGVSSARPQLGITGRIVEEGKYYVETQLGIAELTEEQAVKTEGSFQAATTGFYISVIQDGTDAASKLQKGDIITSFDGQPLTVYEQLREYLYECSVGDTITLEYVRNGEKASVQIVLGAGT